MRSIGNLHKKKSVLIFLPAQNFNEQEYLIITDTLENAGYMLFIVSDSPSICSGSNGLKVKNDVMLYNARQENFAGLVIVGGNGTRNYWLNTTLHNLARNFTKNEKPVGAICSAPIVLAKAGLLNNEATCFHEDIKYLEREGIVFKNIPVCKTNRIITGQDPNSASDFVKAFLFELSKA